MSKLTDAQRERAISLWGEGKNLGAIAYAVGCSIYDLSPWLYADEMRQAVKDADPAASRSRGRDQ